jgi:hypothetical protein
LAAQTHFLKLQVTELFFVGKVGVELDPAGLHGRFFGLELLGELNATLRVDRHLERADTIETPSGVRERLNQTLFTKADGLELFEEIADVVFIGCGIVAGEQNGAAGERSFDRVQGWRGFALGTFRAGGELGVGAVSGELRGGNVRV